jgi:hypothetical protein
MAAALWGLAAIVVGVPTLLMAFQRSPLVTGEGRPLSQPIDFDHRHHAGDDAIDCRYCHDLVDRSPSAGVPPTERCLNCHSQIWNESPLLAQVWQSFEQRRPIRWTRVHALPDFVFFDHSAHVRNGVGCVTCHGRVDQMPRIAQSVPLTMGWCLACHRDPEPNLRPPEAIASLDWTPPPGSEPALGRELAARYGVHPSTDCSTCHR